MLSLAEVRCGPCPHAGTHQHQPAYQHTNIHHMTICVQFAVTAHAVACHVCSLPIQVYLPRTKKICTHKPCTVSTHSPGTNDQVMYTKVLKMLPLLAASMQLAAAAAAAMLGMTSGVATTRQLHTSSILCPIVLNLCRFGALTLVGRGTSSSESAISAVSRLGCSKK